MKIVIQTQHTENYGAHTWDGEGECPQRWKCKGGDTYIAEGVSIADAMNPGFYDTLFDLIEENNEYYCEYILSSDLVDEMGFDVSDYCEDWVNPIMLSFDGENWNASKEHYTNHMPARQWVLGEAA